MVLLNMPIIFLWQKTFDLATNMNLIYQIPLFRAYGIMWDVLGAPPTDGQYPFIAWFRGLHGRELLPFSVVTSRQQGSRLSAVRLR